MRKYTLLDGYTATNGYVIKQDQKGYLWIGTDNGALRFDGKKFQVLHDRPCLQIRKYYPATLMEKTGYCWYPCSIVLLIIKMVKSFPAAAIARLNLIWNTRLNSVFTDVFTGNIWLSNGTRMKTLHCFSANDIRKIDVPDSGMSIVAVRNDRIICFNKGNDQLRQYDLREKRYRPVYDSGMKPFSYKGFTETKEDGKYIFVSDQPKQKQTFMHSGMTAPCISSKRFPAIFKKVIHFYRSVVKYLV